MSNHARITKTLHQQVIALAPFVNPADQQATAAYRNVVDLAEYVDRSFAIGVTAFRGGYNAPHLHRQLDEAESDGPDIRVIHARIHSNITDLDAERVRRRGPQRLPGA